MSKQTTNETIGKVCVSLGERSYDILIGQHLLSNPSYFADLATRYSSAVIVSNTTVAPLYMAQLATTLGTLFDQVHQVVLPDGEQYKDWQNLHLIFDAMLQNKCDRKTLVFALGGGVIGDMTGFAAACYMRGVDFVQVPTTLLAQVDSSVGGKTGINHQLGKNMIGAFYQPKRVVIDVTTLQSLAEREFRSGLGEAIKYGPIFDQQLFEWMENNLSAILARDELILIKLIKRCCEIKAQVVASDEHESSLRAILNFGHTFGHAIEAGLGYGKWLHGEAVTAGMIMAADLSQRLSMLSPRWCDRLRQLIEAATLPTISPNLGVDRYIQLMQVDKKAHNGQIKFVLIEGMGKAVVQIVPDELVRSVIADNCIKNV